LEAACFPPVESTLEFDVATFANHISKLSEKVEDITSLQNLCGNYFALCEKRLDSGLDITNYTLKNQVTYMFLTKELCLYI
jgi:hypothetical protein